MSLRTVGSVTRTNVANSLTRMLPRAFTISRICRRRSPGNIRNLSPLKRPARLGCPGLRSQHHLFTSESFWFRLLLEAF
jgi:hypothetical protein